MGENTKIEWAHHTFNPWRGCTKVAEGCANCYAETLSNRNPTTLGIWGPNGTRVRGADAAWRQPVKWNKAAGAAGKRHRVFCASLADVFEDWNGPIVDSSGRRLYKCEHGNYAAMNDGVPVLHDQATMADLRRDLFALIDATPHLDWLVLTKRPENIQRMWLAMANTKGRTIYQPYRQNVWLLTSVATQADADQNIPELLKCRDLAPVLGISAEPLVASVSVNGWLPHKFDGETADTLRFAGHDEATIDEALRSLDWVIVGGESGHGARPCKCSWIKSIIDECKAADVPCFVKQLGAVIHARDGIDPIDQLTGSVKFSQGPDANTAVIELNDPKGGDWSEWPEYLRVREFPKSEVALHQWTN